jgi:hypothetical protein
MAFQEAAMTWMQAPQDSPPTSRPPRPRRSGDFVEALERRELFAGQDVINPRAALAAVVLDRGGLGYNIDLTYTDNVAIDTSTIDGTDITITGPGGYNNLGVFLSVTDNAAGLKTAHYRVPTPVIFGTYTVTMNPQEVADTSGNFVPLGPLGTFTAGLNVGGSPTPIANPAFQNPDFAVAVLKVPTKAATLGPSSVTLRVSNLGNFPTPAGTPLKIAASTDRTLGDQDPVVTTINLPRLAAGESRKIKVSLTVPDVPVGSYYVIAKADPNNAVPEVSETNNTGVSTDQVPISVPFIDLSPSIVGTQPVQVVGGAPGKTTIIVSNLGTATFDRTANVRLYLSTDGTLDTSDHLVQSLDNTPLKIAAGGEKKLHVKFNYPTNVPDGPYFLIAQTDVGSAALDPNPGNDTAVSSTSTLILAPYIDLRADSISVISGPIARTRNRARVTIGNLGNVPAAGPLTISFSAVGVTLPNGVAPIGTFQTNIRIGADGTQRVTIPFDLPPTVPAGSFVFRATLDPDQRFSERDETNNTVDSVNPFPVPAA